MNITCLDVVPWEAHAIIYVMRNAEPGSNREERSDKPQKRKLLLQIGAVFFNNVNSIKNKARL